MSKMFEYVNNSLRKIYGHGDYINFVVDFTKMLNSETIERSILIGVDDLDKVYTLNNIKGFILFLPIMYGADVVDIIKVINRIDWKGSLLMYDVQSDTSQKWIQKVPVFPGMRLMGVDNIEGNFFVAKWEKFQHIRDNRSFENSIAS